MVDLSDRKKKILSAVIETNIKNKNAEAVSSKQLQEEYLPKLSSATIRNELNALEEMGYLTHLHTSSGRVPTKEGYEKYINELMRERRLSPKERDVIQSNFAHKLINIRDIIERSAKTISNATNYASVVYSGPSRNAIIEDIKLYPVSKTTQLIVVVTDENIINELAYLGTNNEEDLKAAGDILKELFIGKPLSLIKDREFRDKVVTKELKKYKDVFDKVLDAIMASNHIADDITIAGKEKLIEYPEFNDVEKLKKTIATLEQSENIIPILKNDDGLELSINIGGDDSGIEDCSVVTVSCNVKGKSKITAGVIGPMRMDYPKAISVLREVAETIENVLSDEGE
ncbi:MAG: heat-inducible transcription repressor HrcA [Clostridiales bacterium]|nr:heat-inducible transcription repressor HrcA [Clostridiales bacterium]